MLLVLPPTKKTLQPYCCETGSNVGGKTLNIAYMPEYQSFLGKRGKMEAKKGDLKSPLPWLLRKA